MITILIFKALADLGFYFTPALLAIALFHVSYRWIFTGLILMTAGYALSWPLMDKGRIRFLPMVPVLLQMLLTLARIVLGSAPESIAESVTGLSGVMTGSTNISIWYILVLLPAFLYVMKNIRDRQYTLVREREIDHFKFYMPMVVVLLLGEIFVEAFAAMKGYTIPMALIVMASQIMLMRALRHDREVYCQPKYQALNLLILTAIGVGTRFLSSDLFISSALSILATLFRLFIRPILYVLLFILEWVIYVIFRIVSLFVKDFGEEIPIIVSPESASDALDDFFVMQQADTSYAGLIRAILIIVLATAVCFLVYLLFRYLSDQSGVTLKTERQTTERVSLKPAQKQKTFRPGSKNPVEQVREQYRRYLALLRSNGMRIKSSDTSLDVLRKTETQDHEVKLRNIYLNARYDGKADSEDARAAKALLGEIKKAKTKAIREKLEKPAD